MAKRKRKHVIWCVVTSRGEHEFRSKAKARQVANTLHKLGYRAHLRKK